MSFENKSTDELVKIAKAGLGFTLNSVTLTPEDLHKIAIAAKESGARISIVYTADLASEELTSIFQRTRMSDVLIPF